MVLFKSLMQIILQFSISNLSNAYIVHRG